MHILAAEIDTEILNFRIFAGCLTFADLKNSLT